VLSPRTFKVSICRDGRKTWNFVRAFIHPEDPGQGYPVGTGQQSLQVETGTESSTRDRGAGGRGAAFLAGSTAELLRATHLPSKAGMSFSFIDMMLATTQSIKDSPSGGWTGGKAVSFL